MATIYLIHAKGTYAYKIGYTTGNVNRRLKKLQTGSFAELAFVDLIKIPEENELGLDDLLDSTEIPKVFEKAMHKALNLYREQGEWFMFESLEPYLQAKQIVFGDNWEGIKKYVNRIHEKDKKRLVDEKVNRYAEAEGFYKSALDKRWRWDELEQEAHNEHLKVERSASETRQLDHARKSGYLYLILNQWFYNRKCESDCDSIKERDWKKYIEEDHSQKFNHKVNVETVNDYLLIHKYYREVITVYKRDSWGYKSMLETIEELRLRYEIIDAEIEKAVKEIQNSEVFPLVNKSNK